MKKILFGTVICACATLFAAENPVFTMFPDDIVFSLPFDDESCNADMASGKAEPNRIVGTAEFSDGLFGKSLANGEPIYSADKNISLITPGTLLIWVTPTNWSIEPGERKTEPGFQVFQSNGGGFELLVGKMSGQPWGQGHLNTYVQYNAGKNGATSCILYGEANNKKWPNNEWRLLAVTWSGGTLTNSINGKKSIQVQLKAPIIAEPKWFRIRNNSDGMKVDEVIILKRQISDDEIKKLYEATMKALAEK